MTREKGKSLTKGRKTLAIAAGIGIGAATLALGERRRRARLAELSGKVVVITGGSRGLGLALARRFVELGCRVAICGRDAERLQEAADELLERIATNGSGEVLAVTCDVTDPFDVERLFEVVTATMGRVDVLVTCAGTIQVGPVEAMSLHDIRYAMDSLFWSAAYASLAALPIMRRQGSGRIAHVTSIGGKIGIPHLLPYSAAKFAEVGFSEALRAEVARYGIGVTTIVPGLMRTGSYVHAQFKGHTEAEYGWFGLGATTPIVAMSADRAARAIVRAIVRGNDEVVLGWPYKLAERVHAIAPSITRRVAGLVGRMLPSADGESAAEPWREGLDIEREEQERPSVRVVSRMGRDEAVRFHQR